MGYSAVLRNRLFLLIWSAQVLSQTAQNVVNFALVVEVERLTHSSTNVSWVIVSFSLPALLLGPPAGVFVDRTSKRAVLLWTNLLRAALMLAFLLAPQNLQAIYAVTFAASAISQFFLPAEGAIIPLLVKRHELLTATSLFNLTFTGAQVAGFVVLGPTLYKLFGPTSLFVAVVVMYCLAALCVGSLPRREAVQTSVWAAARRAVHVVHVWRDMLEAARFLRAAPGVSLAIFHLTLATGLLMTLATLGPGFVARVLGLGAEDVGYILAPAGAGMLGATALLGQYAVHSDRRRLAGAGLLAMAVSLVALALLGQVSGQAQAAIGTLGYLGLVCLLTLSLGVEFSLVTIPAQSVVSEATDEAVRGRVFALLFMLTGSVSAVPTVLVGVLADNLGIWQMFLALGAIVAFFGVASLRPIRAPAAAAPPP
ncbi:MAG TPA: MFS transporter [Chloroflexota bacterium]|nr:MFS transporter [Chloroflexota bacterium]